MLGHFYLLFYEYNLKSSEAALQRGLPEKNHCCGRSLIALPLRIVETSPSARPSCSSIDIPLGKNKLRLCEETV